MTGHHIGDNVQFMKLSQFLSDHKMSVAEFATRIGVRRQAVHRYQQGRIPDRETMEMIIRETNGTVTPNDFYPLVGAEDQHDGGAA